MAAHNFPECVKRLLAHEGGYGNHPSDPGGPTNFGITIHDYRRYVNSNASAAELRAMPIDTAKTIYRSKYWAALRCDELASGLDYAVFDYAVNSGTARAAKVLQRVVGRASVSDRIDTETLAFVRARDPKALIAAVCDERAAFLRRLKTWPVFGAGWNRRVREVRAVSLAMAAKQDPSLPQPASRANGKAVVPLNTTAQKGTAGGALAAGTAAAGQAAQSGARPLVIAVILVATLALAVAVWIFWRRWQRRQQTAAV